MISTENVKINQKSFIILLVHIIH